MSEEERKSFIQVLTVLHSYTFFIVTHKGCDIDDYLNLCDKRIDLRIHYFDKCYFKSIWGYNTLMLSKVFYETFSIFEYILIYQLDAYVFRDELSSWCSQRYDFIGAPINSLNKLNIEHLATEMNGGFSLRRTTSFLQAYSGISWYMFVIMTSYKPKPLFRRFLKILIIIIQAFIYKHSLKLVFSHQTNEDLVWSRMPTFKKVQYEKALSFSFERQPSLSFSITKELPFGCHAWGKYEKLSFYSFFIK